MDVSTPHSSPLDGRVVGGKYRLLEPIGAGGMGVVYSAEHIDLGRPFALKVLPSALLSVPDAIARFRREARVASGIQSEHVVQMIDLGADPAVGFFLVMELLTGEDLEHRLARGDRVSPAIAATIAAQVARGLLRAHAAGVIHRDLKPGNIFLTARDDGALHVRIVDFGIAKLVGELVDSDRSLTSDGALVGTASYMSPEAARGEPLDARTDIWALGAVLYEMLAGTPPYPMQSGHARTLMRIVAEPCPPLERVAPWTPRELVDIVARALERDMNARTLEAWEMARALEAFSARAAPSTLEVVETASAHSALDRGAGVSEWFMHGVRGLEHGLDVADRPSGAGDLVVEISVDGLTPSLSSDRHFVALRDGLGKRVLGYGDLAASDADGRTLPATMQVDSEAIVLRVRDAGARYPIVIDPLVWSEATPALTESRGAPNDAFGT